MAHDIPAAAAARPAVEAATRCPLCAAASAHVFFELGSVPVHCNILWPTAEAAKGARRGRIRLALCSGCGLIFNAAFDASLVTYDESYENSLHYSPRFEAYADALAQDLSQRLALRGQLVVEVGCGKGDFLRKLCRVAGARGLGIDASYDPDAAPAGEGEAVTFVREPFSSLPEDVKPALVYCRHVLEHLTEPRRFIEEFAIAARRSAACRVFIEVPNVLWTLRDLGVWDVIYEHCSYFSAPALTRLCEDAGLRVERVYSTFGDQFLCIEASAGPRPVPRGAEGELHELARLCERFADEYRRKVDYWQERLSELQRSGRAVLLWGAGSKGITFVNALPAAASVSCLVDLNPRKQGRFVPGTGQQVVGPEALQDLKADLVIVMNPLYREEVRGLVRQLGVDCEIETA